MSLSEFRWNKKRKHYAYLFKKKGSYIKNLLIHSDPSKKDGWNKEKEIIFKKKHIRLFRHPNHKKSGSLQYYVEMRIYNDLENSFEKRIYIWEWDINDKRKIKRLKKGRRTR